MSIDLDVDMPRPITVAALLEGARRAMRELIPSDMTHDVTLTLWEKGSESPLTYDKIGCSAGEGYVIRIIGYDAKVVLITYDLSDGIDPQPILRSAVEVSGSRTALAFVLGAAVAISLGRSLSVDIEDSQRAWSLSHQVQQNSY